MHAVSDGVRRRDVALKLLPAGEEPAEFRTLRQLAHPGIVRVLDVGRAPTGEAWFTMDLVSGRPLGVPPEAQDAATALRRIAMLLDAVAVLHDRGWVHGDLKPDNVVLREDDRPVLIDFGLALGVDDLERGLRGTLGWIAPEVIAGADASPLSDLYAVGVLAYGELCGGLPFEFDANDPGLGATERISPPSGDLLGDATVGWISALLRRDSRLRPASARAALASLEALAGCPLVPAEDRAARLGPTRPFRREQVIDRACRAVRDGALVFVVADRGAGRTTVLREIDDRLRAGGMSTSGLSLGGGPGIERRTIEAFVADRGAPMPARAAAPGRDTRHATEAWQQRHAELELHIAEALQHTRVLLVDDLEPESLVGAVILEALGRSKTLGAVVAAATEARPALERAAQARRGGASLVLTLDALSGDDIAGWLRSALGPVRGLRSLASWLAEATGGVPGVLRRQVAALLEDGLLRSGEAEWYWDRDALDAWERVAGLETATQSSAELAVLSRAAQEEGDLRLASHLCQAALATADLAPEERGALHLDLGHLLRVTGDSRGAADAFAAAREDLPPADALAAGIWQADACTFAGDLDLALALLDAAPPDPLLRADHARIRGDTLLRLGRYDDAREAAAVLQQTARTPAELANAAVFSANIDIFQARGADAEKTARQALASLPSTLDPGSVGAVQVALGNALRLSGRLDEAGAPYKAALANLKKAGRLLDAARVANNLGILLYQQGDPLGAVTAWEEFRHNARRGGVALEYFNALNNLGCAYRDTGQAERARQALEEALVLARDGSHTGLAMILGNLAEAEAVAGLIERAEDLYRECIDVSRAQDNAAEEAEAWRRLAQLRLDAGDIEHLADLLERARTAANDADAGLELLLVRGLARALAIRKAGGGEELDEGLTLADQLEEAGVRFEADRLRLRLVEALAARDRLEEAELRLDELEGRLRAVAARPELVRVDAVRRQIREATRYHLADISRHYDALQDLTLALSRERELGPLLDLILERALELVGEERGYVILLDDEGVPALRASRQVGEQTIAEDLAPSRSVTRRVMATRRPLVVLDVEKEDSLRSRQSVMAAGLRSVICVPILRGDDLLGVIYVDGREAVGGAAERKGSLLMACAGAASVAIENARLIRALQAKNDALAIMAHELRTPIGAIIGFISEVMAGETESRDEDLELMGFVKSEAERVSHMVSQVLSMARTEAGRLEWRRELVDPLELVLAATDTLRGLARQAEVTLARAAADDVDEFVGDRDRLIQVLDNLVGNAIKFSPRGGTINVQALGLDGGVAILVEDEGPGVPEDRLDSIFEAYKQAGPVGQREKGVGLGLAVSLEIVRRHKGRLWAENRAEGGARFTLWLPAAEGERSHP